jgi:hypothetical protein
MRLQLVQRNCSLLPNSAKKIFGILALILEFGDPLFNVLIQGVEVREHRSLLEFRNKL